MPRTVAFLNQKGGVGKTSTTFHLAGALAQSGKRVLLIDNDPQASLTQGFLGPRETVGLDPSETIAAVYTGEAIADRV
ncbi:MAG: ParA family protein, partial [Planctomycetaceae bacterium]|nr:ParA family protein [Planctomycetaceae bacterium]